MAKSLISQESTPQEFCHTFLRKIYELPEDKYSSRESLVHEAAHVYCNQQPDNNKVMMTVSYDTNGLSWLWRRRSTQEAAFRPSSWVCCRWRLCCAFMLLYPFNNKRHPTLDKSIALLYCIELSVHLKREKKLTFFWTNSNLIERN